MKLTECAGVTMGRLAEDETFVATRLNFRFGSISATRIPAPRPVMTLFPSAIKKPLGHFTA